MATYITRVELHDADEDKDYDILHAAMEKRGFSRLITTKNGMRHLPNAEYFRNQPGLMIATVLSDAENGAKETGKRYSILVTEAAAMTSTGLEPVKVETVELPDSEG